MMPSALLFGIGGRVVRSPTTAVTKCSWISQAWGSLWAGLLPWVQQGSASDTLLSPPRASQGLIPGVGFGFAFSWMKVCFSSSFLQISKLLLGPWMEFLMMTAPCFLSLLIFLYSLPFLFSSSSFLNLFALLFLLFLHSVYLFTHLFHSIPSRKIY